MKIRVADYIVNKLAEAGVKTAFSVVGGGAMHLNDAFGHSEHIKVIYNHHEQACAMAAEGYARVNGEMAAVVVTTGPGGINALNGVAGAFIDSVPMIVISGQVRFDTTVKSTGLPLRSFGDQEFDIVTTVQNMTKYAEMITETEKIRYVIEKAIYIATHGRKGPTWVDVPMNIQGSIIETDDLIGYNETPEKLPFPSDEVLDEILAKLKAAKRPVIYAGSAIRLAGVYDEFRTLIEKLNCPTVVAWNSSDALENDHPLYAGRPGIFGDRFGNFAVQNSDLVISLGCRLSIRQTGYNYKMWAPKAYVIMVDIDETEMKKPSIHVELPIHADVKDVVNGLLARIEENNHTACYAPWIAQCQCWKANYPVVLERHYTQQDKANAYAVVDMLSKGLPEGMITVSGNGTACVVGGHAYFIKKGSRFIENSGMASMGYDLPASVGACIAANKSEMICLTGDGSIQMNLQELQTIIHHKLPIKIIVINNGGYHSIRQTQKNFFCDHALCGIGCDSIDDLSFPDMEKIAWAYGFKFTRSFTNDDFAKYMKTDFNSKCPQIIEVMVDTIQRFEPKSGTMKLDDGSLVSAPLEDLAPFLDREELCKIMKVSCDEE